MTDEKKEQVKALLNNAITALLDAQILMLSDATESVYPWNRERVLGKELCAAYLASERAESVTIDAFRTFTEVQL